MAYETKLCAYIIFEHLPKLAPIILRDKKHVASMDTLTRIFYFWGGCLVGYIIYHVSLCHLLQKLTTVLFHMFCCVCFVKLTVKQVLSPAPKLNIYPPSGWQRCLNVSTCKFLNNSEEFFEKSFMVFEVL